MGQNADTDRQPLQAFVFLPTSFGKGSSDDSKADFMLVGEFSILRHAKLFGEGNTEEQGIIYVLYIHPERPLFY